MAKPLLYDIFERLWQRICDRFNTQEEFEYKIYGYSGDDLYVYPEGTTEISDAWGNVLTGNTKVKCIVLPASVLWISYCEGDGVFENCTNLEVVKVLGHLSEIGQQTFKGCTNLKRIEYLGTLPDGSPDTADTIYANAFNSCGLTDIDVSNTTTFNGAIFGKSLNTVAVKVADLATWQNKTFTVASSNPLFYGRYLYENGQRVTNLDLCGKWTSSSIGQYAFVGGQFTNIKIPKCVTTIGSRAFDKNFLSYTVDLTDYGSTETFPSIAADTFVGAGKGNAPAKILVATGRKYELMNMTNWSKWATDSVVEEVRDAGAYEVVQTVKDNFDGGIGYEESGAMDIIPEQTITLTDDGIYDFPHMTLTEGASYTVKLGDSLYECVAKVGTLEGYTITYVGNGAWFGQEPTDDPFALGSVDVGSIFTLAAPDYAGQQVVFSVTGLGTTIHKIESKYIAAIIDVNELPTTDINEDAFYRLLAPYGIYNGAVQGGTVYVVNTLPESGERCTNDGQTFAVGYYNKADGAVYGYVDATLSAMLSVPAGWYPAENLFAVIDMPYGGVVDSVDGATAENTFYFVRDYSLYSYKIEWQPVKSPGWKGTASGAEKFNSYLNVASGAASHAEGLKTTASGSTSHAEGLFTIASAQSSHAEGQYTAASGFASHAEGLETTASGYYSHAEGSFTEARGIYSHAEGLATLAHSDYQHVQGRYNIEDTEVKYAHIVGNGTTALAHSNAHTLDWHGNAWFAGDVYVGGTGQDDANAQKVLAPSAFTSADGWTTYHDADVFEEGPGIYLAKIVSTEYNGSTSAMMFIEIPSNLSDCAVTFCQSAGGTWLLPDHKVVHASISWNDTDSYVEVHICERKPDGTSDYVGEDIFIQVKKLG